jgi:hypothetical protein
MSRVAVVLLDRDGVSFANHMPVSRENLYKSIPIIGVKNTGF